MVQNQKRRDLAITYLFALRTTRLFKPWCFTPSSLPTPASSANVAPRRTRNLLEPTGSIPLRASGTGMLHWHPAQRNRSFATWLNANAQ
jgi:hypothetical protein